MGEVPEKPALEELIQPENMERAKWLFELLKSRRATRDYDLSKPVPEEVINKILEAATLSPSPENYQPWKFIVIRDQKTKDLLGEAAIRTCKNIIGMGVSRVGEEHHMSYFPRKEVIETAVRVMATGWRMEYVRTAPVVVMIAIDTGWLSNYSGTEVHAMLADRTHCPWVYATPHLKELSAIMTAGSVMIHMWLMAHAMGLGACLCNFQLTDPDDEAIIANYLGVDYPRWRLAGLMVFGWPLKPRRGPPRRAVEEVTFAEKWGEPYKMEKTFDW